MSRPGTDEPRLIFVRHGQASLGSQDYDRLSGQGQRQARKTGRRLAAILGGEAVLWSGTHRRHFQTVTGMVPDRKSRPSPDLNEFSTFSLVRAAVVQAERLGLQRPADDLLADPRTHLSSLLAWFPDVLEAWQVGQLAADDIDPWPQFRQRVLSPVAEWRDDLSAGRSVVVVSSAGVISTLVAELTGRGLGYQRQLAVSMYNASISELYPGPSGWRAGAINCIVHLEDNGLATLA